MMTPYNSSQYLIENNSSPMINDEDDVDIIPSKFIPLKDKEEDVVFNDLILIRQPSESGVSTNDENENENQSEQNSSSSNLKSNFCLPRE